MRYQIMKENLKILQAFVAESIENLRLIQADILKLAKENLCNNTIDNILKKIHIIKGLASFFSLEEIRRLGYQIEYILENIPKNSDCLPGTITQLLLASNEAIIEILEQVGEGCERAEEESVIEVIVNCKQDVDQLINDIELFFYEDTAYGAEGIIVESSPEVQEVDKPNIASSISQSEDEVSILSDELKQGLVEDFLLEADEHSAIITDHLLLTLDINPADTEALGDLFRRVHSLKGNVGLLLSVPFDEVGIVVFKELLQVLQNMESLLAYLRDNRLPMDGEIINVCFETLDALSGIVKMLRSGRILSRGDQLQELSSKMLELRDSFQHTVRARGDNVVAIAAVNNKISTENNIVTKDKTTVAVSPSIRVSGEKIDWIMNIIGELSITKNVFSQIARKLNLEHNLPNLAREVKEAGQFVNRISVELEEAIMAMRMTEVRMAFQKFPRIVRDIGLQTGKNITLIMEGQDTELDKNIIEQIGDPLLHLVRNSCDHGIGTVEERQGAGKDPQGSIWLRAYNRGKYVIIEVEDDGRGMDWEKLKNKAVEKGFCTTQEAEIMLPEQAFQLIFLPGFSTAQSVTEISGRGVGMDVVYSNITALQGTIKVNSELGKGTKITMQLPLTLMVSRGLVVEVQEQLLVIPIENVLEMVKVSADKLVNRCGKRILYHRGEVLGVVTLAELLKMPEAKLPAYAPIIIITDGQAKVAMIVDKLFNDQDVLVKPLPDYLTAIGGVGGATIMGDGKVALVLNPVELLQLAIG